MNIGLRRQFQWISSESGSPELLRQLDRRMAAYYSEAATRTSYQQMVDAASESQADAEKALCEAVLARRPQSVLEIGAGSGRIYRRLRSSGYAADYCGLEMSPDVIARNRQAHPEAAWVCGSIYDADLPAASFDVVFAFFVLEHVVYPGRALRRMASLRRPGGAIVLVFPDFTELGIFASQRLGFVDGNAGERLRRGDVLNAAINFYDARIRLRRALRRAVQERGAFPVNLAPRCLSEPATVVPDVDAVYIASAREVAGWGRANGLEATFPAGRDGQFREVVLISLQ